MVFNDLKQNWNPIKSRYAFTLLVVPLISIIAISYLYSFFSAEIIESLLHYEGTVSLVFIISIRIAILTILTVFIFITWLKAEESYISDIPCLMGIFFGTIIFGKAIDILHNLTHYTASTDANMMILKIRFFIAIGSIFPLLFLGINMLLAFRALNENSRYQNEILRLKVRNAIILLIIAFYATLVVIAPDSTFIGILLPIFTLPALFLTTWIFVIAYRNQRLSQVHPGILSIGFILYLFSNIFRPVMMFVLGKTAMYALVSESLDVLIFVIIFIGLITKKEYKVK